MPVFTQEQQRVEYDRRAKILKDYLSSPEYVEKLVARLKINDACRRSIEAQAYAWQLCERQDNTTEGCKFFINNFLYTFNPKLEPKHFPFLTFPFQDDAIEWMVNHIESGQDAFIEKSREMGATWLFFCAIPLYFWLFRDGINILTGSYKEMLVDDKTTDSIFGKIDYLIYALPKWMLPKRFNHLKHRTKLKLINPSTGNLISGDTMNPQFGRGARKTAVLFDELGFWDYAKDAWEGCGDTTSCRIANSTPHGYNYYAMLRESGIDILTLHWKQHPLKDDTWYDFEKSRRTEEELAQEIDISYSKSREGKVYSEWNDVNVRTGIHEYDPGLPLYIGWDFGKCLTEDTEALTLNGWKHHSEINKNDLIYTLNPETGLGEWQKMRDKLVMHVNEIITKVSGKGFKSNFTQGHSFPVKRNGIYELDIFDNINSYESIPSGAELSSLPKKNKYSNAFVELVAWYWTEGYNNNGGVEISQAKPENFDRIRDCLFSVYRDNFIERKPTLRKNANLPLIRWYIYKKDAKDLLDVVEDKKIVKYEFLNSLTKEQLELFVETSLLADGCKNVLKQSIPERVERFAYASLLLGKKLSFGQENMGIYGMYKNVTLFTTPPKVVAYNFRKRNKTKQKKYKGKVWCPTVDNHIWLARSQGTVYFTGNTDDTAIIWAQPNRDEGLNIIDTYRNTGKNIDYYIPLVTGIIPGDWDYRYTKEELELIDYHKNWKKGTHFGDPAGRFRNQVSDATVESVLRDYGVQMNYKDQWKIFALRKSSTKKLLMQGINLNDNARTRYFSICIMNSSYPRVKSEGVEQTRSEKPKHDAYCLAGDTEIRTLQGWIPIKNLVGKEFYTYSYSHEEKRLVPVKAGRCWKSGINQKLLEIGLDNELSIKTTPWHLFMLRDGSWKQAQELEKNDSLMPFYERNAKSYPEIILNDGSFTKEHIYVYTRLVGNIPLYYHIDHIDGDKTNNNPENLKTLSANEHCSKTFKGKSMKERKDMGKNLIPYITKYTESKILKDCLYCGKEILVERKQSYCDKKCLTAAYKDRNSYSERKKHKDSKKINHKVRFIKEILPEDVYDIEIPKYHNFVANGIVLHNSHYRSALEYLALGLKDMTGRSIKPYDKFKPKEGRQINRKNRVVGY